MVTQWIGNHMEKTGQDDVGIQYLNKSIELTHYLQTMQAEEQKNNLDVEMCELMLSVCKCHHALKQFDHT